MPAASIELYQTDNVTQFTTADFGTLAGGATSATVTVHVWNAFGAPLADTAQDVVVRVLSKFVGDADYDSDDRIDTERWVQARINGVSDPNAIGIVSQTTAWKPIGQGAQVAVNDILADAARVLELRVVMPADATASAQIQVQLNVLNNHNATALEQGHYEGGQRGILCGYGDLGFTEIHEGGACTETGAPDDKCNVTNLKWVYKGVPYIKLAHAITLAAATGGNAYWSTLSVKNGTITSTLSAEGVSPLSTTLRPAVPTGERLLAYVHVDDTAVNTADIYQEDLVYGFGYLETALFAATIGRLQALVDNRLVTIGHESSVTIIASETNTIWILPGGTLENTIAGVDPSDERALPIWEVTTDGTSETARRDLRTFLGPELYMMEIPFADALTAAINRTAAVPPGRNWYLDLPDPITVGQGNLGTTSGQTRYDIKTSPDASAFTTLFTAGTGGMPQIAYNATLAVNSDALPEVLLIPAASVVQGIVDSVPGAGSPVDGFLLIRMRAQG